MWGETLWELIYNGGQYVGVIVWCLLCGGVVWEVVVPRVAEDGGVVR